MKSSILQEMIKKIKKVRKKIITIDDLHLLTKGFFSTENYNQKLYKLIYYLKQRGHLISIKKDIFIIKKPEDSREPAYFIDEYYRHILYQQCNKLISGKWYIGGEIALAIHLHQYTIPDEITIVNNDKQGYEMILSGKQIKRKVYTAKKRNLTHKFFKYTDTVNISGIKLNIANINLALLESLYNNNLQDPIIIEMVKKVLKKHKDFPLESFEEILKLGKHHSSIKQLYILSKQYNKKFSDQLAIIIKKWSFFVSGE